MRRSVFFYALAFLLVLGVWTEAFAQMTGSTGSSGGTSTVRTMGTTGTSSGFGTSSGLGGSSGFGGSGSGTGSNSPSFSQTIPYKYQTRQAGAFVGSDTNNLPSVFGGMIQDSGNAAASGVSGVGYRTMRSGSSSGRSGSSYGGTGSSYGGTGSSYGGLSSSSGRSGSSYGGTGSSYGGTGSSYGGTGSSYGGTGSSYGRSGSSYGGTGSSYGGGMGSSYGGMGSSSGRSGSSYGGTGSSYGRSGSMSGGYGSSLARGATMGGYGTTGLGATGYNQQLPVSINISFPFQPRTPETVSRGLSSVLTKPGRLQALSPVAVSVRGETAVLRGAVATQHDRDLAAQLVRLEPGVAQVDNQLTVGPSSSPSVASPATP